MTEKFLGVIGGSGLYSMSELNIIEKVSVDTPFGAPSEDVVIGELKKSRTYYLIGMYRLKKRTKSALNRTRGNICLNF